MQAKYAKQRSAGILVLPWENCHGNGHDSLETSRFISFPGLSGEHRHTPYLGQALISRSLLTHCVFNNKVSI
jgi:hypothetical protein